MYCGIPIIVEMRKNMISYYVFFLVSGSQVNESRLRLEKRLCKSINMDKHMYLDNT